MEMPEPGVSMEIPAGWVLDNPHVCHKGRGSTGVILVEPLEGKTFAELAAQLSAEFGGQVLSQESLKICGYDALRAHVRVRTGVHLLRVYIHKGDNVICVSFATESEEAFSKCEAALLKSIDSITIR